MKVTLSGEVSVTVEDEALFDDVKLPVKFACELDEKAVTFADGKVKLSFSVPVELSVSEAEWSRAVGEVLARALNPAA